MKKILIIMLAVIMSGIAVSAQTSNSQTSSSSAAQTENKTKKTVFRATKDQITQAQKMLKAAETGKMDDDFRAAIKKFQSENGLKSTGTLNRATLEKMNIALTDKQKEIPVDQNSFASADSNKSPETKKRGPVFRAAKEQIMEAQKKLKDGGMYAGEQTGKLDDATRDGIKKFQTANGVKVTGTLNRETLEKMGIALTDKQKEM